MTIRHLRVFIAVCSEGSITKAARQLYLSQPTVSLLIRELEEHYGRRLFDRCGKRIHITPFGREMLRYAIEIVNHMDEMEKAAKDASRTDRINAGCGIAFGKLMMPEIAKRFRASQPNCGLHVTVLSFNSLVPLLLNSQLDFSIVESTMRHDELEYHPFLSVPIVGICHQNNPLARKEKVLPEDIRDQPLLLRHSGSPVRMAVDMFLANNNIKANVMWDSVSALALINAVAQDLGISFLPLYHVLALRTSEIHIMDVEGLDLRQYVNVVHRKGKILSPSMLAFLQCAIEVLGDSRCIDPACPFLAGSAGGACSHMLSR